MRSAAAIVLCSDACCGAIHAARRRVAIASTTGTHVAASPGLRCVGVSVPRVCDRVIVGWHLRRCQRVCLSTSDCAQGVAIQTRPSACEPRSSSAAHVILATRYAAAKVWCIERCTAVTIPKWRIDCGVHARLRAACVYCRTAGCGGYTECVSGRADHIVRRPGRNPCRQCSGRRKLDRVISCQRVSGPRHHTWRCNRNSR